MKALLLDAEEKTAKVGNVNKPVPKSNEILVQVIAISLNPIDPLYVGNPLGQTGRTVGSDFSGLITSIGDSVPGSSNLEIGDRVAGFLQGACSVNLRAGAFAEYLTIDWDLLWRVPDNITLEAAAGVSLVALTAAQGIWYRLGLQAPFVYDETKSLAENPEWNWRKSNERSEAELLNVFIYGASTSVALYAAQMVRLSAEASNKKIKVFGTASKDKWELLKAEPYRYDHLVDYHDQDWPSQIKNLSGDVGMHFAYDCISEGDTVERVSSILARNGVAAIVRSRAGGAWVGDDLPVEPVYGAVWEGLGEEVQYQGFTVKKSSAARDFAVRFYDWLGDTAGKKWVPNPIRIMPGGLESVVNDGFRLLGAGTMDKRDIKRNEPWMRPVGAEKLVYRL
ncbi:chaperonin 10-like protein [Dendryphion nanum]|uniref:Chaperonin 10-like protein n=1 Tax=Dendryphion nanum TaxID=256645 RepID=A0A9P9IKW0_9PLEO|nr:chaperonin 10-like protein [Dendryphion nanum]